MHSSSIVLENYNSPIIIEKNRLVIGDHLGGFDDRLLSHILDRVVLVAKEKNIKQVDTGYLFDEKIRSSYPGIDFRYDQSLIGGRGWETLVNYRVHPEIDFKNFLCSFNGSAHVSRRLLVALLNRLGWFDKNYSSKNFVFSKNTLDGHLVDLTGDRSRFYLKFFVDQRDDFYNQIVSFDYDRGNHLGNVKHLENKLTQSFVHIVSETMSTSYYPFITEKFIYSIVTRGLFLAWAQPSWHHNLEKYFGFRKYETLFDYSFDQVLNPVERLLSLTSMISKFSVLTPDDWKDLYHLESDTIEYNYDHYFSKNYIKHLEKFC